MSLLLILALFLLLGLFFRSKGQDYTFKRFVAIDEEGFWVSPQNNRFCALLVDCP